MLLDGNQNLKIANFGVARVEAINPSDMTGETRTLAYNKVGGLLTKPLLRFLLDAHMHVGGSSMSSGLFSAKNLPLLTNGQDTESSKDIGNPLDSSKIVYQYWRAFDDTFNRPIFGGRGFVAIIYASTT